MWVCYDAPRMTVLEVENEAREALWQPEKW